MGNTNNPPADVLGLPLSVRAEMAMKVAVKKVIERHAREGRPLYIWRDGKVAEVPAKELLDQSEETK